MKKEVHTETPAERETRLKRFMEMTDKENAANIASDPDAQVPNSPEFLARGRWVTPKQGEVIFPVALDAKTARWLDEHHVDYQSFLSSVLKAYVESQQKHS